MSTSMIEKPVTATPAPRLHPLALKAAREAFEYHSRTKTLADWDAQFRRAMAL